MSSIVEIRDLDTAEELISELTPSTSGLWRRGNHIDHNADWIFRGQSNNADGTTWTLLPAAHRHRDAFLQFVQSAVSPLRPLPAAEQRDEEMLHVMQFASFADRHGFMIPGDDPELRDRRITTPRSSNQPGFPAPHLVAVTGLAQHHGVPTRLLDWTWKPLVAAYFAAEPVARRRVPGAPLPSGEAPYSVFALRRSVVEACNGLDPEVHILTVPTATNANLHAQGGQFSLVQPLTTDEHPLPAVDEVLKRHESRILARDDYNWRHLFPMLVEFRVPASEARTTMLTLSHLGVSAASVYPGLRGVVDALKESRFYQWAAPGQRS